MAAATCDQHPDMPLVATCRSCSAKLCAQCRWLDGLTPLCLICHRRARRAPWIRLGVIVPLVGALAYGGYYAWSKIEPPFDYGKATADVRKLEAQLSASPCDRPTIMELVSVMLRAGDSRGVVAKADAFDAKCGEYLALRGVTQHAHARLGEHDASIADLGRLVASEPTNPNYIAWRGVAYQDKGDDAHAIEDFQKALALSPDLADIPQNLATSLERAGRPCEAMPPLDHLISRYPDRPWVPRIQGRIDELATKGHCDRVRADVDHVSIPTHPGKTIHVDAKVNGVEAGVFVVDTGASYVTITEAGAANVGLDLRGARKVKLETANGERQGLLVTARSVDVKGLSADRVQVVVIDFIGPGVDGLLGMSYLSRFDIRKEASAFEIRARAAASAPAAP